MPLRPSDTNGITPEMYDRTVGRYHTIEREDYTDFAETCRASPSSKIRSKYIWMLNSGSPRMTFYTDWFKQKQPWFIGTINQNFTHMTPESWSKIPSNTNLNESSHSATNAATGIQLTLLDTIKSWASLLFDYISFLLYYDLFSSRLYDMKQSGTIIQAQQHSVTVNRNGNGAQRARDGVGKSSSKRKKTEGDITAGGTGRRQKRRVEPDDEDTCAGECTNLFHLLAELCTLLLMLTIFLEPSAEPLFPISFTAPPTFATFSPDPSSSTTIPFTQSPYFESPQAFTQPTNMLHHPNGLHLDPFADYSQTEEPVTDSGPDRVYMAALDPRLI